MSKAKVRLSLQFTIDFDDTPLHQGEAPEEQEYNQRQLRLLQTVLSDKKRRLTFLRYCIASQMELVSWRDWYQFLLGDEDAQVKMVLAPSLATLPQDDQEFFQEAEEHDVFYENVEEMIDCFSTSLESVKMRIVENER